MTLRYRVKRYLILCLKALFLYVETIFTDSRNHAKFQRIQNKIDAYDKELDELFPEQSKRVQ